MFKEYIRLVSPDFFEDEFGTIIREIRTNENQLEVFIYLLHLSFDSILIKKG